MQSQPTPNLKMLFLGLLLMMALLVMIPTTSTLAQSCGAGEQAHQVARGESMFGIASKYGVSPYILASHNGKTIESVIYTGNILCIPAGSSTPATSNQAPVVQAVTNLPATTVITTNVAPGHENWCYAGGPWGDGRCIVPGNPTLQDYWYLAGWCNAQVQLGHLQGTADSCITSILGTTNPAPAETITFDYSLVDDDEEFACTVIYNKYTGSVVSLAKWDEEYDDQDQVIFYTDLPGLFTYAIDLDKKDHKKGDVKYTEPYRTFNRSSAKITIDDADDIESVRCERIEVKN